MNCLSQAKNLVFLDPRKPLTAIITANNMTAGEPAAGLANAGPGKKTAASPTDTENRRTKKQRSIDLS